MIFRRDMTFSWHARPLEKNNFYSPSKYAGSKTWRNKQGTKITLIFIASQSKKLLFIYIFGGSN